MFMSLMTRETEFYRSFTRLTLALVLEQVAVLSVNLLDNVMIGNYSETSLAAITAINQIQFIFQYLMTGVTNGMLSLGSQYHGNRMDGHLKKIIAAATRLALLFAAILFLLSCFVPFMQIVYLLRARRALLATAEEKGVALRIPTWTLVLPSLVFPVLFINVIALSVLQNGLNRMYAFEDE